MTTYSFDTHLFRRNNISRRIEILEATSLYELAEAIVGAYGFDFDHAFGFFSDVKEYCFRSEKKYELFADMEDMGIEATGSGSVTKTKVSQVWSTPGDKMMLLFDYGDDWRFVVTLKAFGEKGSEKKYPLVLTKIGKAPKQYR